MDTSVGVRVQLLFVTIIIAVLTSLSIAANNNFASPPNVGCVCPNERLMFDCTTVGLGSTIWRVTAFDCTANQIILRHTRFTDVGGTSGDCNDGAIIGKSTGVDGNCYTSQLNATATAGLHNQNVTCILNSNGVMVPIGNASITLASVLYQEAPSGVTLTDVKPNELTFSWTLVDSACDPSGYNITSDCGTCRIATATTATCTDLRLPSRCYYSIQNVVCGQVGPASTPITITLRAPNQPNVTFVPVYSADTQKLIKFKAVVYQEAFFNITDGISGSVTNYNFSYSGNTTLTSACVDSTCEYLVDVVPSLCSPSTNIIVILSPLNRLGLGPPSNPTIIGCMNQILQVEYNSATSAIVCIFLNPTNVSKSCAVMYGHCDGTLSYASEGKSTAEAPNSIALNVDSDSLECYVVTASTDGVNIVVEGRESISAGNNNILVIIIVIIIVAVALTAILTVAVVLVITTVAKLKAHSIATNCNNVSNERKQNDIELVQQHKGLGKKDVSPNS